MVSRRQLLNGIAGSSLLVTSAGCVGTRWWEEEDAETGSTDRGDPDDSESASDEESSTGDTTDETDTEESADMPSEDDSEEPTDEEDRQHEPDEEDLEVDEDEYEDHGTSETEERSTDEIEIDAEADLEDNGAARVAGTVTNVSETAIDVVDLGITFSDTDGGYLTADLVSMHDLGAGERDSFESTITPDQARGQPGHVDIEPTVYDRAD